MEYVIAQLVLAAAGVVALRWMARRRAQRHADDVWADETVDWLRAVKAAPETPEIMRDLNRGFALVERARPRPVAMGPDGRVRPAGLGDSVFGFTVLKDERVPDDTAYLMRQARYDIEREMLVMNPRSVAIITGIS